MRRLFVFTALLGGSCADEPAERVHASGQAAAILEGADAARRTGVVHIENALSGERCSGALVAPDLVLTAAHCAFSRDDLATEPLPADGFRVGFGSSTDELDIATVRSVLIPSPDLPLLLSERVDAGLDVAALVLSRPAASSCEVHALEFDIQPTTATSLELVGYGIVSNETGESGVKLSGSNHVVGWDRERGILELEGAGGCLGDSGGPALSGDRWVGLISSVSTSDHGATCAGRTFLNTLLNPQVRDWLTGMLAEPGDDPGSRDGGVQTPDLPPDMPSTQPDPVDTPDATEPAEQTAPYGSCSVSAGRSQHAWWLAWLFTTLVLYYRRGSRAA